MAKYTDVHHVVIQFAKIVFDGVLMRLTQLLMAVFNDFAMSTSLAVRLLSEEANAFVSPNLPA